MQAMRLCMCSGRQFEKTFENSLWRKIVKMQPIACVHSDNLRRHLKNHSGEKLFKCNYASVLAGNVRKLLKTHSREKSYKCNQCDLTSVHSYDLQAMRLCICSDRQFEKTFENSHWGNVLQMLPMRLCICSGRQFEKTFENSFWRKIFQMQPMRLCIC